jgi:galactokinase
MPEFPALFGRPPARRAGAHGRVNLIGEHTDYNAGFVLPVPIPLTTTAEIVTHQDRRVRAWSANLPDAVPVEFAPGDERPTGSWIDYVQGLTWALRERGARIPGFDLRIESDIPLGAGLGSSAALEVAVLRALRDASGLALDDVALALVARRAESGFVGAPVGIMDQFVASLGAARTGLLLDTRTLEHRAVPMPASIDLLVIDSGIPHRHSTGDYRRRRDECAEAAWRLGVPALRDLGESDLDHAATLPPPLGRRVRHVVSENARVLRVARALEDGRYDDLGALLADAHRSLTQDFEVSLPEIDVLVQVAAADPGVLGARLTGGGFGGAIVVLARESQGATSGARIVEEYRRQTGRPGRVLVPAGIPRPA